MSAMRVHCAKQNTHGLHTAPAVLRAHTATHLRGKHGVLAADCLQKLAEICDARVERPRLIITAVPSGTGDAMLHFLGERKHTGVSSHHEQLFLGFCASSRRVRAAALTAAGKLRI